MMNGLSFLLTIFATIALLQLVRAVTIDDCSGADADAKLSFVDIENCGEKDSFCPFIRGRNASIEVGFKATKTFKSANIKVVGKFGPIKQEFKINPSEACGNYGFKCPVQPNQDAKLKLTLPVKKFYPKNLQVAVTFTLLDENKKTIFCIGFPAKIVNE